MLFFSSAFGINPTKERKQLKLFVLRELEDVFVNQESKRTEKEEELPVWSRYLSQCGWNIQKPSRNVSQEL